MCIRDRLNAVYDVPQTRGYAPGPQVTNPVWQFWLESTAWNADASEKQRTFLFDWYAVKWIYVPAPYIPVSYTHLHSARLRLF